MAEVLSTPPNGRPALVLNADYRPLSYYPLSLWPWQDVVKAVFLDRVDVIAEYDHYVRSPSFEMRLPSVIALREFVRQDRNPAFTRFNVFLRDGFKCVYCHSPENLTFDHVIPRSKGGRTSWENIVAACSPCNLKKVGGCLMIATCTLNGSQHVRTITNSKRSDASFRLITCTIRGWTISTGI